MSYSRAGARYVWLQMTLSVLAEYRARCLPNVRACKTWALRTAILRKRRSLLGIKLGQHPAMATTNIYQSF